MQQKFQNINVESFIRSLIVIFILNVNNGGVYDMDNMLIVTPKFHKEILDPKYHFGRRIALCWIDYI